MRRGLGFHARHSPGGAFSPLSLFTGGVQGAWYDPSDSTTLFTDRAGTTPCGTPGQGSVVPVGLMLDKSKNGVGTNGAKRVNLLTFSEQFDNAAWNAVSAGVTFSGSVASFTSTAYRYQNTGAIPNINGVTYTVRVKLSSPTGKATILFRMANGSSGADSVSQLVNLTATPTVYTLTRTFTASGTSIDVGLDNRAALGADGIAGDVVATEFDLRLTSEASTLPLYQRIDANWYSTMAGNHAIAANDTTARPELRARVNLLTFSEQFDNAAWFKAGVTITAGGSQITAPDGTVTADLLTVNAGSSTKLIRPTAFPSIPAGTQVTGSVYLKAGTHNFFSISVTETTNGSIFAVATVNLATGLVTKTGTGGGGGTIIGTPTCTPVGNGWFRVSLTATYPSGTAAILWGYANSSATPTYDAANYGAETWAAAGTETGYLWGAQLTATNEFPANTYQRIVDANTYDAVGFPRYLVANGTSSAMSTPGNVNLSGTDKVTVFAGVRKLSDAAVTIITELSANAGANAGAFFLTAPGAGGAISRYGAVSRGSVAAASFDTNNLYPAPISNVLTLSGDIPADSATIRVNGVQTGSSSADQGTGNFGSYPLFIGARNTSSLFFNGNIYSLLVVGSAVSAGQISATEQWVAGKVGITI